MKTAIIVQARMTSTRLPGKVLMDVAGHPLLSQQIRRLKSIKLAEEIVIATTVNGDDDPIVRLADAEGVRWYRGSEQDVLSRYLGAARESNCAVVVRVTSDCPLIDPEETEKVIAELIAHPSTCDYAANVLERTLPRGLDSEAMYIDTLERIGRLATSPSAREHVTYYLHRERPDLFVTRSVTHPVDNSDLRWTVDEWADLELIRRLYERLGLGEAQVPYLDIIKFVRNNPELQRINHHVAQKNA